MNEKFLWTEKYRPQTIDECILPEGLKQTFREYVQKGQIPTFLFHGKSGIGKTTIARALCNEIGAEYMFINGSDETGIDVLRTKIKSFASTVSLTDARKVVILDEADYLNPNSTQPALRAFIEEFSDNCSFIFTCNYKNRILKELHSRCTVVDFNVSGQEKVEMAGAFYKRVVKILKAEGIEYDNKVVAELITKHFPDYRRVLNELQTYSVSGRIDSGILVNLSGESYKKLFKLMKGKEFTEVRKWVAANNDDTQQVFRSLYDNATSFLDPSSIPQLVLILADYQFKASFVADHELNMMACLTEIMGGCKFL